jgi:acyl-coenzyme A synthetase/AMP-(fatty) acid ligase
MPGRAPGVATHAVAAQPTGSAAASALGPRGGPAVTPESPLATLLTTTGRAAAPVALGPEGTVGLAELRDAVARAAASIAAEPGTSAALYHGDSYEFAVWLLACWHAGRTVVVPADDVAETRAALAAEGHLALGELASADRRPAGAATLAPIARDTVLLRVYTSGSTGRPAVIDKTVAQLEAEIRAIDAALGPAAPPGAAVAGTVSHQHFYGLMFRVLWPLATGRPLVRRSVRYPDELAALPLAPPPVLVTSPVFLGVLAGGGRPRAMHLGLVLSAGSPLATATARDVCEATAAPLHEIYGSAETGAVALRRAPGGDWEPLPGIGIRVAADGTLEIEAAQLAARGWQPTADRARATAAGFELTGRADRLAKVADKRVSLDHLEAALEATALITAARVVVLPGPRPELGAVMVPSRAGQAALARDGAFATGRSLRRALAGEFEAVVLPRRFRFVAELPRDALGKTRLAELAALFAPARRRPIVSAREAGDGRLALRLEIDRSLACFRGHFPGQPVVPGVAQLEWVIGFAREAFDIRGAFQGVDALKFQRIIAPGMAVTLTLEWRGTTLAFRFESDTPHSSGRLLFSGTP